MTPDGPDIPADGIAIVGMSCRFPNAGTVDQFWKNLRDGVESMVEFTDQQLLDSGVSREQWEHPNYVRRGYPLEGIDLFDAGFFDISASEACMIDPQHRLALECAYEALENAGYPPGPDSRSVGVFAGCRISEYALYYVDRPDLHELGGSPPATDLRRRTTNERDYIATRISYRLNLTGPSLTVQTACSTALVAVHLACRSLLAGESELALAGAATVKLPHLAGYVHSDGMIFSPDGHTRAFDAEGAGTIFSSGVGMVALKRLDQAVADGDTIYAVIRGSAVNNDGNRAKASFTAPSPVGQRQVVIDALQSAGIGADTVSYIEAHGTGTALGDPIEISALTGAFQTFTNERQFCAVGSVKGNVGHMVQAAGIGGLIKTALMLHHKEIAPSLNFERPNPAIDFENSPFFVSTRLEPWTTGPTPRRAGVSSFGIGGTNAHVVLEEAPARSVGETHNDGLPSLVVLSGSSDQALRKSAERMAEFLQSPNPPSLGDVAYTTQVGRHHFRHRMSVAVESTQSLAESLGRFAQGDANGVAHGVQNEAKTIFLFTGQGPQHPGMGRQLLETCAVFRTNLETCAEILAPHLDRPLLEVMYPDDATSTLLDDTSYTQPALFALEYALAETWMSWGVAPDAVIGHSLGEYPAACLAGVLSLEDGLRIAVARGRLIDQVAETGAMATIYASENHVAGILADFPGLSVAACNGRENTVISGRADDVRAAVDRFEAGATETRIMDGKYAFHSALIEPALPGFHDLLSSTELRHPQIPFFSTLTGAVENARIAEPAYWVEQARMRVRFAQAVRNAMDDGYSIFLEIGPKPILTALAMGEEDSEDAYFGYSLHPREPDLTRMLGTLGQLFVRGADVDWPSLNDSLTRTPRRVPLPTYPFQRKSYWSTKRARTESQKAVVSSSRSHPTLGSLIDSPLDQSIYTNSIGADEFSFLRDHIVHDKHTMPAAAMVETVHSAAADRLRDHDGFTIRELGTLTPMFFERDSPQPMQTVVAPRDDGTFSVSLFTRSADDWIQHGTADVVPGRIDRPTVASLIEQKRRCNRQGSVSDHYERLNRAGAAFGPGMQGIKELWYADRDDALGSVELDVAPSEPGFTMHPGLLDGCGQVGAAACRRHTDTGGVPYLPYLWEGIRVFAPFPDRLWCHAKVESVVDDQIRTAALTVYAPDGTLLATVDALHYKKAPREAFLRTANAGALPLTWLAERHWTGVDLESLSPNQHWWVITYDEAAARLIARELSNASQTCETTVLDEALSADRAAALLRDQIGRDRPRLHGIIYYCPNVRGPSKSDRQERIAGNALSLLQAVEGLADTPEGSEYQDIRIVFVTVGAQPTGSEVAPIDPTGSTLWGMAKAARRESAELDLVTVDLPSGDDLDLGRALIECLRAADREQCIAWRSNQVLRERLVPYRGMPAGLRGSFQLQLGQAGVLESLQWKSVERPVPGHDEVLVKVEAAALNFRDVLFVLDRLEGTLGYDCSGVVVECGRNVTRFKPGDAVLALGDHTLASHVTIPEAQVAHRPPTMTPETAAGLPIVFLTARYALENLAGLKSGEWVLLHAAAGGVGLAAIQIAKQIGAHVIATAHPSKWALLRELGVEHIASSRTLQFADLVMDVTEGRGVDVVLNTLANEFVPKSFEALKRGGRFVELGRLNVWTDEEVAEKRPDVSFHHFLMGTVAREHPGLVAELLKTTVDAIDEGVIRATPIRVYPADRVVDAFEMMSQARHVGKLVVSLRGFPENEDQTPIRSEDAAYLVTGGLGGLGLQLAEWLVEQGATHLVLLGRRRPNDEAERVIARLRSRGAEVRTHAVDVSDRSRMKALFERLKTEGPRLRGIFHLAGVLDDGVVIHQNWDRFERVFAPKVSGTLNLHELSKDIGLDHFVLFSSVASLLGTGGQSNYAAANAFMDSLAAARRQLGLPAISINWGAWGGDAGMAAGLNGSQTSRGQSRLGVIEPGIGFRFLHSLLQWPAGQIGVCSMKWDEPVSNDGASKDSALDSFSDLASDPERLALIRDRLLYHVSKVLGLGSSLVEVDVSLQHYGLDSLAALVLRNRVMADFRSARVPIAAFVSGPTIVELGNAILEALAAVPAWEEGVI